MDSKELENFVELLYPYFLKKLKSDGLLKNYVKMKNATVVSDSVAENETNIDKKVDVMFPYDSTSFSVLNKTGENLNKGDVVCLMYWVDLKNAVAIFKVKE